MSAEWFYIGHYGQLGPLTREQFEELIQGGVISRDTFVWKNGMPDWVHAERMPELQSIFSVVDPFIAPPPSPVAPPAPRRDPTAAPSSAPPRPVAPSPSPSPFPISNYGSLAQPGISTTQFVSGPISDKNRTLAGILGICLPGFGRMYLGYSAIGALQLIFCIASCGALWLWSVIDGIIILVGGVKTDGYGRVLPD